MTIQSAVTIDPKDQFLWGRSNVDAKGRLQLILIDGGTLGQNYYDLPRGASKVIPARRLTPEPDPRFPCIGVSEVDQELIFRMAHGDLALNDATRPHAFFEFEHDMSMGEFEACDPLRCKLVKQPPAPVHEPASGPHQVQEQRDCASRR
ncbi:MAG TPA: hypothetical protein VKP30_14965 [Polyangiaceae bacterium]|nr:hypothetical protein [Polyangiaceae bacterium]